MGKYCKTFNQLVTPWIELVATNLKVNLVHRCEVAREIRKENVAFENSIAGNTGALKDLGHVLNGDALQGPVC